MVHRESVAVGLVVALVSLLGLAMAGLAAESRVRARAACPDDTPAVATADTHRIVSFDGTAIALTEFRPAGACSARPAPAVLTTHGWGQRRDTPQTLAAPQTPGAPSEHVARGRMIRALLDAGFGVVSVDARGHGESGGSGSLLSPAREIRDFRVVLDWMHDTLDWVMREGDPRDRDIRVGALGASYGGTFQLLTAAFDPRLDALVPIVAWNDLVRSVAPNEAMNETWAQLLVAVDTGLVLSPTLAEVVRHSIAQRRPAEGLGEGLRTSNPEPWIDRVRTPTLLVHGMRDALFPVNEAVRNFEALTRAGADTWLWTFDAGHVLPPVLEPLDDSQAEVDPCRTGMAHPPALDFLKAFVAEDSDAEARIRSLARVSVATDVGTCLRGSSWPVFPQTRAVRLSAFQVPPASTAVLLPALTVTGPTVMTGTPRVEAWALGPPGVVVGVSLVVQRGDHARLVGDQETLLRLRQDAPNGVYEFELAGVATLLDRGDTVYLQVRRHDQTADDVRLGMVLDLPAASTAG